MIKVIPPDAWNLGVPQLEAVKVAHATGLRGHDFAAFVKRASHPLASWVRQNPPKPGEVYGHCIALGCSDKYGSNRNADGYTEAMLRRDHPTFEKYARIYKDHNNRNPAKSYGLIKKSVYNDELGRVELLLAFNATKEAADRNGGLIAESTLQKMASGLDVAVSQSCKVPFDRCVACGHEAKTRVEYCTPQQCVKYGGCRDNLGRVFDDGFHLFVDNPHCTFFDCSDVSSTRGADRTAFITGKVASSRLPGGAELAEQLGLTAPDYLLDPHTLAAAGALRKLAAAQTPPQPAAPSWDDCVAVRAKLAAYQKTAEPTVPADDYGRKQLLAELSAAGVVLPPAQWLSLSSGVAAEKCAAVFAGGVSPSLLLARSDLHELLAAGALDSRLSAGAKYAWLAPTAEAHARESALGVLAAGFSPPQFKAAGEAVPAAVRTEAAARYLAYQANVLALHAHSPALPALERECLRHNRGETV